MMKVCFPLFEPGRKLKLTGYLFPLMLSILVYEALESEFKLMMVSGGKIELRLATTGDILFCRDTGMASIDNGSFSTEN